MSKKILLALILMLASLALGKPLAWNALPINLHGAVPSAIAMDDSLIAVGLPAGGVKMCTRDGRILDTLQLSEFGRKGRIYDLLWRKGWLLIASEGGLTVWDARRHQVVVHLSGSKLGFTQAGAFSLGMRGPDLWVGGLGQLAQVNLEQKKLQSTWTLPGRAGRVQAILPLGGSAYVGTEMMGVQILDFVKSTWKGFDRFDGLPDNQVTGLELVGNRVFVATVQGLGKIDLGVDGATSLPGDWIITQMVQSKGNLLLQTLDGLVLVDGISLVSTPVAWADNGMSSGDLAVQDGLLVCGLDGKGLVKASVPAGVYTDQPVQVLAQGFSVQVNPSEIPAGAKLQAKFWFPERSNVALGADLLVGANAAERMGKLPDDAVGYLVLELEVWKGSELVERRTVQAYRDRTPPTLELEGIPNYVRETPLLIRGHVVEKSLSSLVLEPKGTKVTVGVQGVFEAKAALDTGLNLIELVAKDRAGNEVRYPMQTIFDNQAPRMRWPKGDTVTEGSVQWQVPLLEEHFKSVSATPVEQVVVAYADSLLLVNFRDLHKGANPFQITVEDEAGNRTVKNLVLFYMDERSRIAQQVQDETGQCKTTVAPVAHARVDTVYRCTTAVMPPPEGVPAQALVQIEYHMLRGETLRLVAERFYGDREFFILIAQYNHILDPEEWTRLPVGKKLLIPMWQNFKYGLWNPKDAMQSLTTKEQP